MEIACPLINNRKKLVKHLHYSILESHRPTAIAITPTTMLEMVYKEKWNNCPWLKRECSSNAKVEKVVKPPQKPVPRRRVWFSER